MKYASQAVMLESLAARLNKAEVAPIHLTLKGEAPVKVSVQEMLASLEATYGKKG
jgi:hypothetical protein